MSKAAKKNLSRTCFLTETQIEIKHILEYMTFGRKIYEDLLNPPPPLKQRDDVKEVNIFFPRGGLTQRATQCTPIGHCSFHHSGMTYRSPTIWERCLRPRYQPFEGGDPALLQ